ncbi:MAG TPA: ABC transporter permease [Alphaproteobacteria bacterium]|jgi:putative ABC transport system permease protein|nr:ABC transporter permease [Alphaproteobacteria bacterium]HJM49691.1 ABC transporter permease [Alphaproteobacteria bacterium]
MKSVDALLTALDSLRTNILRTALTTLGIIIGVAAVIAMVAVGAGAERRVQALIQSLGSNVLIVLNGTSVSGGARGGSGSVVSLTTADARALELEIPAVRIAAPMVRGTGQIIFGNANWFTTIYGAPQSYLEARDWVVARGRGFTAADERGARKVALVGQSVVNELFAGSDPIGAGIRIKRVPFTVVGVTAVKGQTPFGRDQDDVVFIPLATAKKRVLGGRKVRADFVGAITVKARTAELVAEAEARVSETLRRRHRIRPGQPDDFVVRNIAQILEARAESQRTMAFLLAAVAGVSLIVGGIGIMNIMLVSVTERTREIGLRMALGARGHDIMVQFVIEAVALSLIGGLIGSLLGVGGSLLVARLADWPMIVSPGAIVLAMGFSAFVGIFFGYYPARKASRLDPIEALRHE